MEYCVPLPPWFGNTEPTFANTEETEVSLRPHHCLRSRAGTNWRPGWLLVLSLSLACLVCGETSQIRSTFKPQATPVESIFHFSVFVNLICAVIFVIVFFLIAYSALRFRARPSDERSEPPQAYGSNRVELAWTVIPVLIVPVVIVMVLFLPAARVIHSVQTEAQPLDTVSAGHHIFDSTSCINCHAISGTVAHGRCGPDLSHLMSRETLRAGAATNTHENLRAWIQDSDSIKPGSLLPAMKVNV